MQLFIGQRRKFGLITPAARSRVPMWPSILLGMAGTAMFNLSPLFVQAIADGFGIADRQLGWLMGAEIAGISLACFIVLRLAERHGVLRAGGIGAGIIVVGNLLTLTVENFTTLLALRFFIGLFGDGLAYAGAIVMLGRRADPTRAFALFTFANMCLTGLALALLPNVPGGAHWQSLLLFFAVLGGAAWLGSRSAVEPPCPRRAPSDRTWSWRSIASLVGLAAFTANLGALWGFAERIGLSKDFRSEEIGLALSISILSQALGSLTAALNSRNDSWRMFAFILLVQLGGLTLIGNSQDLLSFTAGLAIWGVSWNLGLAYMLGGLARLSGGGRLLALAPGTEALGAALGPVIAGSLISKTMVGAVMLVSASAAMLSLLVFSLVAWQQSKATTGRQGTSR